MKMAKLCCKVQFGEIHTQVRTVGSYLARWRFAVLILQPRVDRNKGNKNASHIRRQDFHTRWRTSKPSRFIQMRKRGYVIEREISSNGSCIYVFLQRHAFAAPMQQTKRSLTINVHRTCIFLRFVHHPPLKRKRTLENATKWKCPTVFLNISRLPPLQKMSTRTLIVNDP